MLMSFLGSVRRNVWQQRQRSYFMPPMTRLCHLRSIYLSSWWWWSLNHPDANRKHMSIKARSHSWISQSLISKSCQQNSKRQTNQHYHNRNGGHSLRASWIWLSHYGLSFITSGKQTYLGGWSWRPFFFFIYSHDFEYCFTLPLLTKLRVMINAEYGPDGRASIGAVRPGRALPGVPQTPGKPTLWPLKRLTAGCTGTLSHTVEWRTLFLPSPAQVLWDSATVCFAFQAFEVRLGF